MPLPEGTVTFLFTDIEGSTRLWARNAGAMRSALIRHEFLLRRTIEAHGGAVFKTVGDQVCAAFGSAPRAVAAAVAAQRALHAEEWPAALGPLRVRTALHTGDAQPREGDYLGPPLNRIARLVAAGHGGQILLTRATEELVRDQLPDGTGLRDLGDHRLRDLARPERIFQLTAPDLPAEFPPLVTQDERPNNLPVALTRFIGRAREIEEVRRLLGSTRLLTLTGPGGTGKTRLALQAAAELLDDFPDGVWLVELAPLGDPDYVPHSVASALGVPEEPGRPLISTLVNSLNTRELLLILDNCEHLIVTCAELVDALLHGCPGPRILATSREALGISGETTLHVPPLASPDLRRWPDARGRRGDGRPAAAGSLEHLMEFDSVRLFTDRAASVLPEFAVTEQNALAVAQVCRRLDGIPLAIELAAARVRAMTVEQIAARLDDRFRLLTGGSRTALPRQQTLRALIDWSHDLLSEPERVLLRRLSVFSNGWTLEAAEAVCACVAGDGGWGLEVGERIASTRPLPIPIPHPLTPDLVLDLLTSLVGKSLVQVEKQGEEIRYRLLDTIRQYARDKLLECDEAVGLRERHWEWFVALAEEAEPELHGPDQALWLERLETEHDNLRTALEWSMEREAAEDTRTGTAASAAAPASGAGAVRLAAALWRFWLMRGHLSEGRGWLERVIARGERETVHFATVLHGAGALACQQEDLEAAAAFLDRSVALWRRLGDEREVASSLVWLGRVPLGRGDLAAARSTWEESLRIFRAVDDRRGIARSLNNLGEVARYEGDFARAGALYAQSLELGRETGHHGMISISLHNLGQVALHEGDLHRAAALFGESLALFHRLGDKRCIAACLAGLAAVRAERGLRELASRAGGPETVGQARSLPGAVLRPSGGEPTVDSEGAMADQPQRSVESAACLLGAAEAVLASIGASLPPADRVAYEGSVAAVRAALDAETLAAAWAEGRRMLMEEAIEEAMKEELQCPG